MTENNERMSEAVAEAEFLKFTDAWDIDSNTEKMNAEDKDSFDEQKNRIVNSLIKGRTVITEEGNITYHTVGEEGPDKLDFKVPKGEAYIKMDKFKDRQSIHKMFGFLSSMTGVSSKMFSNMDARDTKFCMAISILFLAS